MQLNKLKRNANVSLVVLAFAVMVLIIYTAIAMYLSVLGTTKMVPLEWLLALFFYISLCAFFSCSAQYEQAQRERENN